MLVTGAPFSLYPVRNLRRARQFYEGVFGLTPLRPPAAAARGRTEYHLGTHRLVLIAATTVLAPGSTGGILALQVEDFDHALDRLRQEHVVVLAGPTRSPHGRSLIVQDPEGNAVAVVERAPDLSGPAIMDQ